MVEVINKINCCWGECISQGGQGLPSIHVGLQRTLELPGEVIGLLRIV